MESQGNRKKQMMVMAGVMVAVLSAAAAIFMTQSALAQQSATNSTQTTNPQAPTMKPGATTTMPQLKGSVNVRDAAKAFLRDNVKVSYANALSAAQGAVSNGTVVGGQLTIAQGYLVYEFKVANLNAGTSQTVIVDAGNGSVLYTSPSMPMHLFGGGHGGFGCERGHFHSFGHRGMGQMMMHPPATTTTTPSSDNSGSGGLSDDSTNL
jgi:uncharacterized membrane protein YkoI